MASNLPDSAIAWRWSLVTGVDLWVCLASQKHLNGERLAPADIDLAARHPLLPSLFMGCRRGSAIGATTTDAGFQTCDCRPFDGCQRHAGCHDCAPGDHTVYSSARRQYSVFCLSLYFLDFMPDFY